MTIQVNIDAEAINKMVADAIIDSAIGQTLREQVAKHCEQFKKTYNNPLEGVLKEHVIKTIRSVIETEYQETIKAAIRAHITEQIVSDICSAGWRALMDEIEKRKQSW